MRNCHFCKSRLTTANRSNEHAIARWIVRALDYQKRVSTGSTMTFQTIPFAPGDTTEILNERTQSIESMVLGGVCTACNNGWMSRLEVTVRPILEALWGDYFPTVLSRKHCETLAKWTFKTAAVLNYASNYKKIIPRAHLRELCVNDTLPANATVDIAVSKDLGMHWVLGGNKKFVVLSENRLHGLRATYLITLQFEKLLLRLAWTSDPRIVAQEIHGGMCRIYPIKQPAKQIHVKKIFQDRWQLHFMATVFAEEGCYPHRLDLNSMSRQKARQMNSYYEPEYMQFVLNELRPKTTYAPGRLYML